MERNRMRFGLIANLRRTGAADTIKTFIKWADKTGCELLLCADLKEAVASKQDFVPRDKLVGSVDVLVAMGGDGTILSAARSVGSLGTPLLGINLGSLGFLTQQTPKELVPALESIAAGNYSLEERMLLKAEISGRDPLPMPYALNDIVLDNGPVSRVLDINLKINGEDVVTYIADGLIISTPTGSTAYNLAVGGPIMKPVMDAMIASPISPFSLTTRPMIFPGNDRLELMVLTEQRIAMLTLDGQVNVELQDSERVTISRAEFRSRFIVFPENSYYKLLRSKLHWGVSPSL
jgi:NAD+ kinase